MQVRHGYTLSDIDRLARLAVHLGSVTLSYQDRQDVAWSAIVEHLYSTSCAIPEHDLVHAGRRAIYDLLRSEQQYWGYYRAHTDGARHGPGSSPAFVTYWSDAVKSTGSPERYLLDHLAMWQILPALRDHERAALVALAAHDTYQAAAAALGVEYQTFKSQIARARRRFLTLWHEGERPSRPWGCDRRAGRTAADVRRGGTAMKARRRRSAALRDGGAE